MSTLHDIVGRPQLSSSSLPSKLPWDEPEFSQRMLAEHLDQTHDKASRRGGIIDTHVDWLFGEVLGGRPGSVVDLGCGPGLYCERLAVRGCRCLGIDFSPAAIAHAERRAADRGLACRYALADLITADLGSGHDLGLLVFGEFNTFARVDAADLLLRTRRSLRPGGQVVIEAHVHDFVVDSGRAGPTWFSSTAGLFSPRPHLVLAERAWDEPMATARTRFHVVDADTGAVEVYGEQLVAYTDDQYRALLAGAGFVDVRLLPGMGAVLDETMVVITAVAPGISRVGS